MLFELRLQEPLGGDLCVSYRFWVKVATVPTECRLDLSVHVQTAVSWTTAWQEGGIPFTVCVLRAFPGGGGCSVGDKGSEVTCVWEAHGEAATSQPSQERQPGDTHPDSGG